MVRALSELRPFTGVRRHIRQNLAALVVVGGVAGCGDFTAPEPVPTTPALTIVDGDGQQALANETLRDSLRVVVKDQGGKPLSGILIGWSASTGEISPASSTTDAEGKAAAAWKFYSPVTGWSAVGTHRATASISGGVGSVSFTGYARAGVVLRSVSITPAIVNVTSSDAVVTVTVRVTDDRTGLGVDYVSMQFFNVTDPPQGGAEAMTWFAVLTRTGGTPADGTWQGIITVPKGTPSGIRKLSLNLSWGCGVMNRKYVYDQQLRSLGMADQVLVTTEPLQADVLPGLRDGEDSLRPPPSFAPADGSLRQSCS